MARIRTSSGHITDEDIAGAVRCAHDAAAQVIAISRELATHVRECERDRREQREDQQRRDDAAERSRAALHKKIDDASANIQELSGQLAADRIERAKESAGNGWDIVRRFAWLVVALALGALSALFAKGG